MKRKASVYERNGTLFVIASHQTKAGFWIDDAQVTCLSQPRHDELGRAVESALARSQSGVATPPADAQIDTPLLIASGVGSWGGFVSSSRYVRVSNDGSSFKITRYRNLGSQGGFEPAADLEVPSSTSAPALGQIVADILSH